MRKLGTGRASRLPGLLALFASCHGLVLVVTQFIWDARTNLDGRRLVPMQVAVVLLAVMGADRQLSRSGASAWRAGRPAAATVTAIVALFSGINVYSAQRWLARTHDQGAGYASREWRESPLLRAVSELPQETMLLSNASDAIVTLTGHVSERIPSRINPSTRQPAPDYATRMATLGTRLARRDGVVAYFRTMSSTRWYLPSETDLVSEWRLEILRETEDGVLYRISDDRH